jgi:hypothetical protein
MEWETGRQIGEDKVLARRGDEGQGRGREGATGISAALIGSSIVVCFCCFFPEKGVGVMGGWSGLMLSPETISLFIICRQNTRIGYDIDCCQGGGHERGGTAHHLSLSVLSLPSIPPGTVNHDSDGERDPVLHPSLNPHTPGDLPFPPCPTRAADVAPSPGQPDCTVYILLGWRAFVWALGGEVR